MLEIKFIRDTHLNFWRTKPDIRISLRINKNNFSIFNHLRDTQIVKTHANLERKFKFWIKPQRVGNLNENWKNLRVRHIWWANTRRLYHQLLSTPRHRHARRTSSYRRRQGVWEVAKRSSQHRSLPTSSADAARRRSSDSLIHSHKRTLIFQTSSLSGLSLTSRLMWFIIKPQYSYLRFKFILNSKPQVHIIQSIYLVLIIFFVLYHVHFL